MTRMVGMDARTHRVSVPRTPSSSRSSDECTVSSPAPCCGSKVPEGSRGNAYFLADMTWRSFSQMDASSSHLGVLGRRSQQESTTSIGRHLRLVIFKAPFTQQHYYRVIGVLGTAPAPWPLAPNRDLASLCDHIYDVEHAKL